MIKETVKNFGLRIFLKVQNIFYSVLF